MSGVGKTAVLHELAARGWPTLDTDDGWCVSTSDGRLLWDVPRLRDALVQDPLVVAGCEENMGELLPLFDRVVLLVAPLDVMRTRIMCRDKAFGGSDQEWARVVADTAQVVPLLRQVADVELDTSALSLANIVTTIDSLLHP